MSSVYHISLLGRSTFYLLEKDFQDLGVSDYRDWPAFPTLVTATLTSEQAEILTGKSYIKEIISEQPFQKSATRTLEAAQWAVDRIDQRSGILDGKFTASPLGTGVRVFVVDSGIRMDHIEFSDRIASEGHHWDFSRDIDDPKYGWHSENDNHGTAVASLIAGRNLGVATRATIHSIRVCDHTDVVFPTNVIAGLSKVLEMKSQLPNDPFIVNLSINGLGRLTMFDQIIGQMISQGIIVVVSAGNNAGKAFDYWPASSGISKNTQGNYQTTSSRKPIVAAATTKPVFLGDGLSDVFWPQSNHGPAVDILAPGHECLVADVSDPTSRTIQSGTSFSAALTSGVAALYLQMNSNLTHQQMRSILVERATKGSVRGLTNLEATTNSLLNTFWVPTDLKWVSPIESFNITAKESRVTEHQIIAVSNIGQDCEQITYTVSPPRSINGQELPAGFKVTNTSQRINGSHPYEFTTILTLFIDCKEIQANQFVELDISVSDGRSTVITRTLKIELVNTGKAPIWESHQDKQSIGSAIQGQNFESVVFEAIDPDGGPIIYNLIAGLLPTGLKFKENKIEGSVGILDKSIDRYELIVRAQNRTGDTSDITLYIEAPVLNQEHSWRTSWLQEFNQMIFEELGNQSFTSIHLGDVIKGTPFHLFLELENTDRDNLTYQTLGIGDFQPKNNLLPQGIRITSEGKITGVPSLVNVPGNYFFRLKVSDGVNSGNPPTENIIFHLTVVNNDEVNTAPTDFVIWETPEGNLGTVYETQRSHFAVKARTPGRGQILYSLAPGELNRLPDGLILDRDTGEIRGVVPFYNRTTPITFTVRARVDNVVSDRTFSFIVENIYYPEGLPSQQAESVMDVIGDLGGINRGTLAQWVTTISNVSDELIFRPQDTLWGRVRIPKLYIVNGLKALSDLESENSKLFMGKLRDYHHKMKLRFGTMSWAKALAPDGKYLYDVIYFNILDPMAKAGGWDNLDNEMVIDYSKPPLEIAAWNLTQGNNRYFPNSLMNIRRDLIITDAEKRTAWTKEVDDEEVIIEDKENRGIGLAGREGLPLWMTTEQIPGDPASVPGYTPAIEILYCQPGRGSRVLAQLQAAGLNEKFQGQLFTVDRYLLNGYGIQKDGELFSSSGGLPTEFDVGMDLGMAYEYPLYFTVRANTTGFLLDTLPVVLNRMVRVERLRAGELTPITNLRIENGKFVVDDPLLNGDVVIMTIVQSGRSTEFDDSLNLGSDALTDNGKYYIFPSSKGRKS